MDQDKNESGVETDLTGRMARAVATQLHQRSLVLLQRAEAALARARAAANVQDLKPP